MSAYHWLNSTCTLILVLLIMVQIISASRHPHGINSGWYHPDWSQFVRWRHYHLGQNAMGAPCAEILSQFEVWLTNLQELQQHNLRFKTGTEMYLKGFNKFMGQSPQQLLSSTMPAVPLSHYYTGDVKRIKLEDQEVAASVDWNMMRYNSGDLGFKANPTGWAISAKKAVEAQFERKTGGELKLLGREIANCSAVPSNRPAITVDAFEFILHKGVRFYPASSGGANSNNSSTSKEFDCTRSEGEGGGAGAGRVFHIKAYHLLEPEDQHNLRLAVALIGPLAVSIRVTENFFLYKSGVFYDTLCQQDWEQPNHAVLLVGYGTHPLLGEYWKIQNNWGSGWGEKGFARMARNTIINCGIASAAFYPEL